jgi:hypothetical protein
MYPYEAIQLGLLEPETTPYYQIGEFTTTKLAQSWVMRVTAGASYYVDWGDGVVDWFAGTGSDQTITHTYAAAGTYHPKWWIQDAKKLLLFNCANNSLTGNLPSFLACTNLSIFQCNNNSFTGSLPSFAAQTELVTFSCYTNSFSGQLPSFSACTKLRYAYFHNNQFSGTLPSFESCVLLTEIVLYNNQFTGTLPSFAACTSLVGFYCRLNGFTGYTPGAIALTCNGWVVDSNAFTQAAVDAMLADMATNIASRPINGTLNLSGGTNAVPSSTGIDNQLLIMQRPWTVTTNWNPSVVSNCILYAGAYSEAKATRNTQPTIVNANFTDTSGWTLGTGWSIANGVATHAAGAQGQLTQSVFTVGNRYSVPWVLNSSNMVQMLIGSASVGPNRGAGTFVEEMTCTGSNVLFIYPETRACVLESVGVGAANLSINSYTPQFTAVAGSVLSQSTDTAKPWVSSDGLGIRYQGTDGDCLTWSAAPSFAKCLHDGTGGTLIIAVKPSVINNYNYLIGNIGDGNPNYPGILFGYFKTNELYLVVSKGTTPYDLTATFSGTTAANNTYVFAIRIASGTNGVNVFQNGVKKYTGSLTAPSSANPNLPISIGSLGAGLPTGINGIVGQPFIANRALTDDEIVKISKFILAQPIL